jgi:hypothetical protein
MTTDVLGTDMDGKPVAVGSHIIYATVGYLRGCVLRRAQVLGRASDCNNCGGKLHLRVLEDGKDKPNTFHYGERCLVTVEQP